MSPWATWAAYASRESHWKTYDAVYSSVTAGGVSSVLLPAHGLPGIWRTSKAGELADRILKRTRGCCAGTATGKSITQEGRASLPKPV